MILHIGQLDKHLIDQFKCKIPDDTVTGKVNTEFFEQACYSTGFTEQLSCYSHQLADLVTHTMSG